MDTTGLGIDLEGFLEEESCVILVSISREVEEVGEEEQQVDLEGVQ